MPQPPKPVVVGDLVARPTRPPTARDPRWYWIARVQVDGERRTVLSGRHDRADLVLELAGAAERRPVAALDSLGLLLRAWTAGVAERVAPPDRPAVRGEISERTLGHYRARRRRLVAAWGDHPLEPRARLERWIEASAYSSLKALRPATVASWIEAISAAWTWGVGRGLVDGRLRLPSVRGRSEPAAPVGREQLLRILAELGDGEADDAVRLVAATGIRGGAPATILVGDVDLARRRFAVTHKGRRRYPPCPEAALRVLRPRVLARLPGEQLFDLSTARSSTTLNQAIRRAAERAGVEPVTCHALRRRVAVDLARSGIAVHVYAATMGHSIAVAARHYLEVDDDDRADVARVLEGRPAGPRSVRIDRDG